MKKKIFMLLALALILTPNVCAAGSDYYYIGYVNSEKIPQNTVFIDMLIPLNTADAEFTSFNEENGEIYGIPKDSQIVDYHVDGFRSYTFHIKDAYANIEPVYYLEYNISKARYEKYISELSAFDMIEEDDGSVTLIRQIPRAAEFLEEANRYAKTLGCDISEQLEFAYVDYLNSYSPNAKSYFIEFSKKYKEARFAYIDADGNILAVTNATDLMLDDEFVLEGIIAVEYDDETIVTYAPMSFRDYFVEAAESDGFTEEYLVFYLLTLAISILSGIAEWILYGLVLAFTLFYVLRRDRQKYSVYLHSLIMNMK